MALKIYTKTGDAGKTSLIGGTKVPKSNIRIDCYGTIDELNSHIGMVSDLFEDAESHSLLRTIQNNLFVIGSSLACDPDKDTGMHIPDLKESDVEELEHAIDKMNESLPVMRWFILPGGHPTVSAIHIARCVCRRAERICVHMQQEGLFIEPLIIKYVNRLSDYLFVLGRFAGASLGVAEIAWHGRTKKS